MVFSLNSTPEILFGSGASEQTGAKVKELGCKKYLLCTVNTLRRVV